MEPKCASRRITHGGGSVKGRRKLARPIAPGKPLHLVLKASQARGHWSLIRKANRRKIEELARKNAKRFGVRLCRLSNLGTELQLLVVPSSRKEVQGFLRALTGTVSFLVTGTRKGRALKRRFWDELAYSCVLEWGEAFDQALRSLDKLAKKGPIARQRKLADRGDP